MSYKSQDFCNDRSDTLCYVHRYFYYLDVISLWLMISNAVSIILTSEQIPLLHISEDIYKISTDWIGRRSFEALGAFVLWLLDSILADLTSHQGVVKGSKKVAQQSSSKSQVPFVIILCAALFDMGL